MSVPKKFSDLPVISEIGANDTLTVVTANGLKRISLSGLLAKVQMSARNLMRSTIYSKVVSGARFTNGRTIGDDSNHRFALTHIIDEQGPYSISFWARCATGPKTFHVDINDCFTNAINSVTVDTEWQFISTTVNVVQSIGQYGFVDFSSAGGVTISDVCVVKGSVPMRDWTPAPEDSASSGGVKYCTSYAREREGGARYEYGESTLKLLVERHLDGRFGGQRIFLEHRPDCHTGCLPWKRSISDYLARHLPIGRFRLGIRLSDSSADTLQRHADSYFRKLQNGAENHGERKLETLARHYALLARKEAVA